MFLFWCAVGRSISGDNGEGSYEANLAAGIRGTSSADSEPGLALGRDRGRTWLPPCAREAPASPHTGME